MSIKNLSKAASALALVGVVAPFLVQSVGAADEPTSALSGVAGVSDPSGSEVLDQAAQSAGGSGTASGYSHAGIGFESGDLILYQVPNFDFSLNNKISDSAYPMIKTGGSRMAVIVDNRYTQKGEKNTAGTGYSWQLSGMAGDFMSSNSHTLNAKEAQLFINKHDSGDSLIKYTKPINKNTVDSTGNQYIPGTLTSSPDGLSLGNDVNISDTASDTAFKQIASAKDSKLPGATGLDFSNTKSAQVVITAEGISSIIAGDDYVSTITWNLTADPLH